MNSASLTFKVLESDELEMSADFGEGGFNQEFVSHLAIAKAAELMTDYLNKVSAEDEVSE